MTNSIAEDDAVWGTNQIIRQLLLEMIEVDCKKRKDFRQINETWQKLKLQNQTLKSRISESLVSDPKIQKDKEKDEKKN
jgi:transposase